MATSVKTQAPASQATGESRKVSRALAVLLCFIPASYFLIIAGYAVLNFAEYGAGIPQFFRYIAAPILIGGLLIWAGRKLSPPRAAEVGIISTGLLLALLLVEIFLNARLVFALFNTVSMLGPNAGEDGASVRGDGGIPPMFSPKQISRDLGIEEPANAILAGAPNREVLHCAKDGEPVYYTADRYGFNNPDELYEGGINVAIVGDSFIEGHCQPREDSIVGRVRRLRPKTASFGMRSGGPLLELAFIGRYGAEYEPDFVVMAFFEGNDWQNLTKETTMPWLAKSLEPDADFGPAQVSEAQKQAIDNMLKDWWSEDVSPSIVLTKSSFVRNIVALNEVWGILGLDYPRVSKEQPIYSDILARSKAVTQSWGGKFALLYIPQDARYRGLLDKSFVYDQLRGNVLQAAEANNIDVIDLTEIFAEAEDPTALYAPDAHFSPEGAQATAEAIDAWIASKRAAADPAAE